MTIKELVDQHGFGVKITFNKNKTWFKPYSNSESIYMGKGNLGHILAFDDSWSKSWRVCDDNKRIG